MTKAKYIIFAILILTILLLMPNIANAAEVNVTRDFYSNNGSMKFNFTNLTLDTTHEYEFGLTKTKAGEVEKWFLITEYTESAVSIDLQTTTSALRNVINAVDTGYITIKDKNTDTIVLQPYAVDLKTPYLLVTSYTVLNNGKELDTTKDNINVALRCASNSKAYYQYEKITDSNIINKYREIKNKNGDILDLQSILKTTVPTANWSTWDFWNGYDSGAGMNGYGYPERTVSLSDSGLYYLWVYFSGNNIKDLYGYILVDNLEPEITLDSISLPKTEEVELEKTLTLKPTFSPANTTNKIVTWSSSDETVATVDNTGKITPKKLGSTIITVTSQDGNKKATCTVTVINKSTNDSESNNTNNDSVNKGNDTTTAKGAIPQTGIGIGLICFITVITVVGVTLYIKYNKLKDVK